MPVKAKAETQALPPLKKFYNFQEEKNPAQFMHINAPFLTIYIQYAYILLVVHPKTHFPFYIFFIFFYYCGKQILRKTNLTKIQKKTRFLSTNKDKKI